jgi:hypothetical protein
MMGLTLDGLVDAAVGGLPSGFPEGIVVASVIEGVRRRWHLSAYAAA